MEYKAGQEYKMKYIDKDQKEHEATYTPDKDTNIAGMINGFKDKTKDFFKLLSIDEKSLDESRKITEEKDSGLKDALDNDVELFDDIYLYLDEYIEDEDTKSEIEDIIDKYTGIGGSAEDLDEDSEEYKSELKDCINEIEDLLNLNESKKITESEDKPELADMLIEINRYYIDYIDNISFFIDLANVAGIDYDKVYDWYKSIKEDENNDLEESKKITESEDEYTYNKDEEEKLRKIFKDLKDGYSYGYDMKNVSYPIFKKVLSIGESSGQKDYGTTYINVNYYGGTSYKITLDNLKWIMNKIFNMTPSKFLSKFIRNDKSTIKD